MGIKTTIRPKGVSDLPIAIQNKLLIEEIRKSLRAKASVKEHKLDIETLSSTVKEDKELLEKAKEELSTKIEDTKDKVLLCRKDALKSVNELSTAQDMVTLELVERLSEVKNSIAKKEPVIARALGKISGCAEDIEDLRRTADLNVEKLNDQLKASKSELSEKIISLEDYLALSKEEIASDIRNVIDISKEKSATNDKDILLLSKRIKDNKDSILENATDTSDIREKIAELETDLKHKLEEIPKVVKDVESFKDKQGIVKLRISYTDGDEEIVDILGDSRFSFRGILSRLNRLNPPSSGGAEATDGSVLYLASIAPFTATYTGSNLTSLVYSDFSGITNHSKTFTYGSRLEDTQEIFDYEGKNWTVDVSYTYSGGSKLDTKSVTITKV